MKSSEPRVVPRPIGVVGLGYVGLVTAATLASLGHDVVCVDIDAEKIRRLREGDVPVVELGLSELLHQHRRPADLVRRTRPTSSAGPGSSSSPSTPRACRAATPTCPASSR